ncbi:MAG: polysaccharide biosynthesis/export family protein [Rikenellaceae bacterium]
MIYFQDMDVAFAQAKSVNYETKIKCDDELSILVSCPDMALAQQYNLNMPTSYMGQYSTIKTTQVGTQTSDVNYRVDANGEINFPVLGKIMVEGMTRAELVEYLTREIKRDIKDPVVTVTVTNFNITIIGDVGRPGNYTFNTEKVNVIQAFAEAGDLSTTSIRDDILLIRNINGRQNYITLDMTSKDILESEHFYLQQNDIIYVKPDVKRQGSTDAKTIWTTLLTTITSVLSITLVIMSL